MLPPEVKKHKEPPGDTDEKDLCIICKHCFGWWSDYFWEDGSNPLDDETVARWQRDLFSKQNFATFGDHGNKDENGRTVNDRKTYTPQEWVAQSLEVTARNIRAQPFRNRAEWEAGKHKFICPKCGKKPQLCDRWDW